MASRADRTFQVEDIALFHGVACHWSTPFLHQVRHGSVHLWIDAELNDGADAAARLLGDLATYGASALEQIDGPFAGALVDTARNHLSLFRDALGLRPLHYRIDDKGVAISTLPQSLARQGVNLGWLARRAALLDERSDETAFLGVRRVLPGGWVDIELDNGRTKDRLWWRPTLQSIANPDPAEILERADCLFQRAVDLAAGSHDPVGLQLSGGLDSSLILTRLAAEPGNRKILAFTGEPTGDVATMDDRLFDDDCARAAANAERLGIPHFACSASVRSLVPDARDWAALGGRPFDNADGLGWGDACYRAARRQGVSRLLTGGSGNDVLSWPGTDALFEPERICERLRRFRLHRQASGASIAGMIAMALPPVRRWLARPARSPFVNSSPPASDRRLGSARRLRQLRAADHGLWFEAVRQRHGLIERDPFADRKLVEFSLRIPEAIFFGDGEQRALARAMLRGHLPAETVEERRRGAQGQDWRARFEASRDDLAAILDDAEADPAIKRHFRIDRMRKSLDHYRPDQPLDGAGEDRYRYQLMRAAMAIDFVRHHGQSG